MRLPMIGRVLASTLLLVVCPLAIGEDEEMAPEEETAVRASGFLGDLAGFRPSVKGGPMLVYTKEDRVLAGYTRFILDPVLIYFDPDATPQVVNPEDLAMLTDFLHAQTAEQLGKARKFQVVSKAGPGVARVRAAITDVAGVDPKKNVGAKAAGLALGVGLLIPTVDVGKASIEVEILDSESGERLVAIADAKKGRRFLNVTKSAKQWGDVKGILKSWAKDLRQRLEEVHG